MSIQNLYPNIAPSLSLDFANTKALDSRVTFARASTARFYDGRTVAKAEENLLTFSEQFDNAAWTKTAVTVTANTTTAPDGTTTADTLTAKAGTAHPRVTQLTTQTGGSHTVTIYAKPGTYGFMQISNGWNIGYFANFDLSLGVVGTKGGNALSSSITPASNGFFRCEVVFQNSVNVSIGLAPSASATYVETWAAAGTETILLWGAQLELGSTATTYQVTTTQPITNYIPVLQTAAAGVPRFDHNPITGESLGLLIEEQRTNLLLRSEEFDNASWSKSNATVTANTIIAPDGTLTGDKIVENTATSSHTVFNSSAITLSTGVAYSYSIYAKAAERSICRLANNEGNGVFFNLATGVVIQAGAGFTGSITSVGNGWYRLNAVETSNSNVSGRLAVALIATGTSTSYTGDGYSGIYIWGAQLEAGGFATSYIPTVASQVTRSRDEASMTGANFSSWYRADEGTFFAQSESFGDAAVRYITFASDATNSNRIAQYFTLGSNTGLVTAGGTLQAGMSVSGTTAAKTSLAYATDNFAFARNATLVTDSAGIVPVGLTQMQIGAGVTSATTPINGTIKKIAFYPKRIADAELQGLTS